MAEMTRSTSILMVAVWAKPPREKAAMKQQARIVGLISDRLLYRLKKARGLSIAGRTDSRLYARRGLNYFFDGAVRVIIHIVHADRAAVAAAGRQGAIVVKEVGLSFIVNYSGMRGKAVGDVLLDDTL